MSDDELQRVVGVSYELGGSAPVVVLKGAGVGAEAVLEAARATPDAPRIVRDPGLVDQLYRIPIDAPIGRELFPVMATLLAHLVTVDRQHSGQNPGDSR